MAEKAVAAEAEVALVGIARAIMGSHRQEASEALKAFVLTSQNAALRKQAEAIIQQIEKLSDYVAAWQVAGPYSEQGKDYLALFDVAFPPERPGAESVEWRALPVLGKPGKPWMLDLAGALGAREHCLVYVRTWLHSDKAQQARLEFGIDDGSKVWLNGKLVHADGVGGAAIPGEHKVNVALRQGWNVLMLKITQATGPWEFCLRLRRPDDSELDGLRLRATPPQAERPAR
jgi:hypothetical protein